MEQIREAPGSDLPRIVQSRSSASRKSSSNCCCCLFAGGHCLITGAPGLAKTLLVHSIAQVFHLKFQRIQFTPDLMPADITGTEILEETGDGHRKMQFVKGPIFANVILADEINRTPPKTQAALLEAMQEHQVTAAGVRYPLEEPFFVLATQNPIEMEGTYPLPEAQLDRFMFNIVDRLPARRGRSGGRDANDVESAANRSNRCSPARTCCDFTKSCGRCPIAEDVVRYAVRLAASLAGPGRADTPDFINEWVSWGAGLRAAQYLVLGAKARALFERPPHVTVRTTSAHWCTPTLRHRILVNYRAEAEGRHGGEGDRPVVGNRAKCPLHNDHRSDANSNAPSRAPQRRLVHRSRDR